MLEKNDFSYKLYISSGDGAPVAELDSERLRVRIAGRGRGRNLDSALWSIEVDGQLQAAGESIDWTDAMLEAARSLCWLALSVEHAAGMADALGVADS